MRRALIALALAVLAARRPAGVGRDQHEPWGRSAGRRRQRSWSHDHPAAPKE